ncbi:TerC family protein [Catenovulum sediminis]|uniref:TerC family protein n=1 Tax=Catenovulum sediminis TaxID=1740262 RepID=A0ABV1RKV0_9ALTE|nr:TerC family protein [Catenovulum sediminis]
MFEWMYDANAWIALFALIGLEIVLGVDNIIFISILVSKLPEAQRDKARKLGISLALLSRLVLLLGIVWVTELIHPWFSILGNEISGRDLVLLGGGLFLLAKATFEIHNALDPDVHGPDKSKIKVGFVSVLIQIAILDVVFSLDSVITAVGLVQHVSIMVIAILISVLVMLLTAKAISDFVDNNPTIKILALSFLMLIGITLMGEGLDLHIPKGYIYFAMFFSVSIELMNMRLRKIKARQKVAEAD